jgi:phage terminase large subunit-like protein
MSDVLRYKSDPQAFIDDLAISVGGEQKRFGDVMAPFQRKRFAALMPALQAVAAGNVPTIGRHFWEATKGASKDSDLAAALLWLLTFSGRTLSCQAGAADQDQADELKRAAKTWVSNNPWLKQFVEVQGWRIINLHTESRCDIVAADVAGSMGSRPDGLLIVNELSCITKREFAENLMDNAAKVNGVVVIATNSGFLDSWQFQWRELARASDRWSFHQYAEPAPWLSPAEMEEAAKRNTRARFNRLWLGIWSHNSGDALDEADIQAAITLAGEFSYRAPREAAFVGGLDLSKRHDRSAFVILGGIHETGRVQLVSVNEWAAGANGKVDFQDIENTIRQARKTYRGLRLRVDPYESEHLCQRLDPKAGEEGGWIEYVPPTGANLTQMANTVLQAFRERTIDLWDHKSLIRDVRKLNIVEKPYGYKLEAPRDETGHADIATAMALALPVALKRASTKKRGFFVTTGDCSTDHVPEPTPPSIYRGGSLSSFVRKATRGY